MRGRLALVAILATIAPVLSAVPAAATAPPPVTSVAVSVKAWIPPRLGGNSEPEVVVSWTGEDQSANGVIVCLVRGTTPSNDANYCDVRKDVSAPSTHTGRFRLRPESGFAFSVFAYANPGDGSSPEYSTAVTTVWHGSNMHTATVPEVITYGQRARLTATLIDVNAKAPLPGQSVALFYVASGSYALHLIDKLTTDAQGSVERMIRPRGRGGYYWVFDGGAGHLSAVGSGGPYVDYRVTAHLTSSRAAPGQDVHLYGVVKPEPSDVTKQAWLYEYQTSGPCKGYYQATGQRVTAKRQLLPNGQRSYGYVMGVSRTTVGSHKFVVGVMTDKHLNGGSSPSVTLTVGNAAAPAYASRC